MTTGKTIPLAIQTFVGKVLSLLCQYFFLMLFKKVPHSFSSKEQVSFNFMAVVPIHSDFGAPKIKSFTVSFFSHLFAVK